MSTWKTFRRSLLVIAVVALAGCQPPDESDGDVAPPPDAAATVQVDEEDLVERLRAGEDLSEEEWEALRSTKPCNPDSVPPGHRPPVVVSVEADTIALLPDPVFLCLRQRMVWRRDPATVLSFEIRWAKEGTSPLVPSGPLPSVGDSAVAWATDTGTYVYDIHVMRTDSTTLEKDPDLVIIP